MSMTRIMIIAHPGANLDSLSAVLPGLVNNAALFYAADATEIQAAALNIHPQLAILDSEIGFQEARLINELLTSQFPQTTIIVLSDAVHWQRWKTINGSHQVLLKGFSTGGLKAALSKALASSSTVETRASS
jgi:DNA-binding NarL/FixJ family response regulator